jgi:hypothetical protein
VTGSAKFCFRRCSDIVYTPHSDNPFVSTHAHKHISTERTREREGEREREREREREYMCTCDKTIPGQPVME